MFISNDEKFAIDISKVERIIEFTPPKKVPEASDFFIRGGNTIQFKGNTYYRFKYEII